MTTKTTSTKFSSKEHKTSYINKKLKVMSQLCIEMGHEQLNHIWSLESEIAVDNYCRSLISNM